MTKSKLKFCWQAHTNPSLRGETRWVNGDLMPEKEVDDFLARFKIAYIGYDFFVERLVVDNSIIN